jgi:hypothetical protein
MNWRGDWWYWLRYRVLWRIVFNQSGYKLSSSQTGEDMVAGSLLSGVRRGFYVDIGAYHPVGLSNTYHYYLRGWRGLTVDANPQTKRLFNLVRPRDISVLACVDVTEGEEKDYHMFDQPALNTITPMGVQRGMEVHGAKLRSTVRMKTRTLNGLMAEHVPAGQEIHLLSVDVEGLDYELLGSVDFARHRPWVVCFEDHEFVSGGLAETPSVALLKQCGYVVAGVTPLSVVMKRADL